MKSLRDYLQLTLARNLQGSDTGSGSFLGSRRTSVTNFVHTVLFSRLRRQSTSSLPQKLPINASMPIDPFKDYHTTRQIPMTSVYMDKWLQTFKYRTNIPQGRTQEGKGYGLAKDTGIRKSQPNLEETSCQHHLIEAMDDTMVWEEDVSETGLPPVYVAQVSLTPCAMFNVATHNNTSYELGVLPTAASAQLGVYEGKNSMEMLSPSSNSVRVFLQKVIRKTSRKKKADNKGNIIDAQLETEHQTKRSPTTLQLGQRSDSKTDQRRCETLSQSKSEPFLDRRRQYFNIRPSATPRKVNRGWNESSKPSKDIHKTGASQAKALRRYPSVERLDNEPYDSRHGTNTANINYVGLRKKGSSSKRKKKWHNPYLRKRNGVEMSWFLRENKHGKVHSHHRLVPVRTLTGSHQSYLHRSVSDPCLTLEMIEQRILSRFERECTVKRCKQSIEYSKSGTDRVDFIIGERNDNSKEYPTKRCLKEVAVSTPYDDSIV